MDRSAFKFQVPRIPKMATDVWRNFVLLGVVVSALMVGSEFTVRWWFSDITTTSDNRSYFAKRWLKSVQTNSQGFREREFSWVKPRGTYRIASLETP